MTEEILLAEMAKFRAKLVRDAGVIVNHQSDIGLLCYGKNRQRHVTNCLKGRILRAELDQISATVAQLLGDEFGRAAIKIGGVDERVEPAIREWFHRVLVNIVSHSQFERRTSAANGPLQMGENIIQWSQRAQARRRENARSQARAMA